MFSPTILILALGSEPFVNAHAHPDSDSEFLSGTCPEGNLLVIVTQAGDEQVVWDDARRIAGAAAMMTGKPAVFAVKFTRLDIGGSIGLPRNVAAHRAQIISSPDGERKYTVTRLDGTVEHYAFCLTTSGDYVVGAVDERGDEAPFGADE